MINERIVSEDGRLSVNLTIHDDGQFAVDIMATKIGTTVHASMEQNGLKPVHIIVRGKVRIDDVY